MRARPVATSPGERNARIQAELKRRPTQWRDAPVTTDEKLRIVRGTYSTLTGAGVLEHGAGFTGVRSGVGAITITFSTAFSDIPTVTASGEGGSTVPSFVVDSISTTSVRIRGFITTTAAAQEVRVLFIAAGPR